VMGATSVDRHVYDDITLAIVVWNDAERLEKLLKYVRPWFKYVAVAVQRSPDDTLAVAKEYADILSEDEHRGFGDASFGPLLLPHIRTTWTFKVDADEWPTEQLLRNLGMLTMLAKEQGNRGVWVPFRSWMDGVEWEEQHSHLRLWHTNVPWPPMLHSRPMIDDTVEGLRWQDFGCIEHRRSTDEMIQDYLNYYRVGLGNKNWEKHNKEMMRSACTGLADRKGWGRVRSYPWWPEVRDIAFEGKEQGMPEVKNTIYVAGTSGSGTRMVYDMATKLMAGTNKKVVHASIPGYRFGEIPNAVEEPVWWDREWMEEKFGEGTWVIVKRDPYHAALSSVRRKFISTPEDYEEYAARGSKVLDKIKGALVLQYEDIVADPQGQMDKLAGYLQRPSKWPGNIFDGNAKHPPKPEPAPEEAPVPKPRRRTRKKTTAEA
jgi:hypothetical protein